VLFDNFRSSFVVVLKEMRILCHFSSFQYCWL